MANFDLVKSLIDIDTSKKVSEIEVTLEVKDCTGTFQITDIMFQGGRNATIWTGHPSELRWAHDW